MATVDEIVTVKVRNLVTALRNDHKDTHFSDIIDDDGRQYIDIVMAGGGVLGIALVGFTYVLESMNIRFLRIGGTSAGAINAILLAGLDSPANAKSERMIKALTEIDFWSFVDGGSQSAKVIDDFRKHAGPLQTTFDFLPIFRDLRQNLGLNPGKTFFDWLSGMLADSHVGTTRDLISQLNISPPGLQIRGGQSIAMDALENRLAIVAADITTQTKVVFPKMAKLYWADVDSVDPALYVRASMSIPFFFNPLLVTNLPNTATTNDDWAEFAGLNVGGAPPSQCYFVDGGILSNFPINLFHISGRVPNAPTFGVKLGSEQRKTTKFTGLRHYAWSIFDSARHCLDYDFIANNSDYKQLVSCIDTGDADWLDFNLSDTTKADLFLRGAQAADRFLRKFDWSAYKFLRQKLADID